VCCSVNAGWLQFTSFDREGEPVLARRQRTGGELGKAAGRSVGAIEIDYDAISAQWLFDVEKSSGRIGLIVGGIVGWLASLIMRTDAQQGVLMNIVVGIVGAVIASLIVGGGTINSDPMDLTNILWSLLGAVILLAIVNLVRRGSVR